MRALRKLRTAFLLQMFGSAELRLVDHEPLTSARHPGECACGLELGHERHGASGREAAARLRGMR